MPSFATSNSGCSAKARPAMKIDKVKPMPPSDAEDLPPTDLRWQRCQAYPDGQPRGAKDADGFTITRPSTMPSEIGLLAAAVPLPSATPSIGQREAA